MVRIRLVLVPLVIVILNKHGGTDRKDRYIARHKKNEDWTKSGAKAAGFYSKHVLWNKPTLKKRVLVILMRFGSLNGKKKNNLTNIYIYI